MLDIVIFLILKRFIAFLTLLNIFIHSMCGSFDLSSSLVKIRLWCKMTLIWFSCFLLNIIRWCHEKATLPADRLKIIKETDFPTVSHAIQSFVNSRHLILNRSLSIFYCSLSISVVDIFLTHHNVSDYCLWYRS